MCDYLAYCLDDPETTSVILFVEGFKRPERFLALADRALELGKPIMAVKVGRSDQAQAAAVAHSGSLAGEARVTDAALDAAGVIRCADLDELLETAELVEGIRRTGRGIGRRPDRGRHGQHRGGVARSPISRRGPGSTCRRSPPRPGERILEALPTMGYIGNPLDPWGAAAASTAYGAAFGAMAASDAYDVLVHRPRLPVSIAGVGGGDGQRRHPLRCSRRPATDRTSCPSTCRSPRASRHPRRRPCSTSEGARSSAAARRARGVRGDRRRRPLGAAAGTPARRTARGGQRWPALAARSYVPTASSPGARSVAAGRDPCPARAREPRAPACGGPGGDVGRSPSPDADAAVEAARSARAATPSASRSTRGTCPTRATSAWSASGSSGTRPSGRAARGGAPLGDGQRDRCARPAGPAHGGPRDRAHHRDAPRRLVRAGRHRRAWAAS